jgi:glutathione-specific gamma-glutamylcyclotransferase
MIGDAYMPLFQTVVTPQRSVEALAFVMDRASPRFADLNSAEAAGIIATGRGVLGTNLEYFVNLADHVAVLGIQDEVFEAIRSQLHHPGWPRE